ncbi:ABC transporter substrate-binding protein [Agrobacterium sp. BA1120]|uniref:ABC transporter substrate-binding protein n=1 Tax=Agrobacterium sp. BA1120 TaxID=3228927 RepID=UPI00336A7C92
MDRIRFATDWLAEADHGGFYQAVADGTYARYNLDVEILQGGPGTQNRSLLLSGKVDFYLGTQQEQILGVGQGIPLVDVAAFYQKNPQVLIAHPGKNLRKLADLSELTTIFMTQGGFSGYFEWIKSNYSGFSDAQYRPYNWSPVQFLSNKDSALQGLITSEPYEVRKAMGVEPQVFLLADAGYKPYATLITTKRDLIETKPELVQRFIDASIEGWYNYLYGDNTVANSLIKATNPDMTDGHIEYATSKIKQFGLVDSGEALDKGIGCLSSQRYTLFFQELVKVGLVEGTLDISRAFDTQFTCKGVGLATKQGR